jgi:hypothetical protein
MWGSDQIKKSFQKHQTTFNTKMSLVSGYVLSLLLDMFVVSGEDLTSLLPICVWLFFGGEGGCHTVQLVAAYHGYKIFCCLHHQNRLTCVQQLSPKIRHISTSIHSINLRQWPTWYTIALFYNTFIIILYMFRGLYTHHQEVELYWCSIWYRHSQ